MTAKAGATVHATVVAVGGRGVLIRGAAGSGKSSTALELIEDPRGDSVLVADDRVLLAFRSGEVVASPPEALCGMIEVRGIGIIRRPFLEEVRIGLVVDLLPPEQCPRLPGDNNSVTVFGAQLPLLRLPIGLSDAAMRVRIALAEWVS